MLLTHHSLKFLAYLGIILLLVAIIFIILGCVRKNKNLAVIAIYIFIIIVVQCIMLWSYLGYVFMDLETKVATDVVYVDNTGEKVLYTRQPSGTSLLWSTLYAYDANNKHEIKRYELNRDTGITSLLNYDNSNVILSSANSIRLCNLKGKTNKILYNTDNDNLITFITMSNDKKYLVFTERHKVVVSDRIYGAIDYRWLSDPLFNYGSVDTKGDIYLYDIKTLSAKIMPYDKDKYGNKPAFPSCSIDNKIIFSSDDNILCYSLDTDNTTFITNGYWPKISENGKYIIYLGIIKEGVSNIYRYNMETKKSEQITFNAGVIEDSVGNKNFTTCIADIAFDLSNMSTFFDISDDGNIVVYTEIKTWSSNNSDKKVSTNICYYNFATDETIKFMTIAPSRQSRVSSFCKLTLSGNGRYLLFTGDGLIDEEARYLPNVYMKDMETGEVKCLSIQSFTWFSPKIRLKI